MLFADLLSLHRVTFLMVFLFLFMSLFSADTCLSWSLPSITEQQVCPHRLLMQYWHWPDQTFFKHSPHTNCISNSVILRNNYISLLSDSCACVHVKKNGVAKEAIVLQWAVRTASWDFKPGKKKQWPGALLSGKCCCFVWKPLWKVHVCVRMSVYAWRASKCVWMCVHACKCVCVCVWIKVSS